MFARLVGRKQDCWRGGGHHEFDDNIQQKCQDQYRQTDIQSSSERQCKHPVVTVAEST